MSPFRVTEAGQELIEVFVKSLTQPSHSRYPMGNREFWARARMGRLTCVAFFTSFLGHLPFP